jgi:hypothetical protein
LPIEYDEERLFTRSRIRTEIEEDKRRQLQAAKKNFLEEKSHLQANLTMKYEVKCSSFGVNTFQLELKDKAAEFEDELDEREAKNKKDYFDKTRDLEDEYEDLLDEEKYGIF